ncbi:MAG: phenylalanine--tRNA ligase subunit beta [Candidatus Peregrinibacteria bacterium]|nr:phenylalanine--tRNA ligase subunit beta [Candidatus Peregrinibacteria bacterium]
MKISLNWLQQFVDFKLVDKDTLQNVVVGYVKSLKKHSGADNLKVAIIDLGDEEVQIVCGGVNLVEKRYVPVAKIGAILPGGWEIKRSKIRGEESYGMICAQEEIRLGSGEPHGIWLLDEKKSWTPGMPLIQALGLEKAYSPKEIGDLLTNHTAEFEGLIPNDTYLQNVVTAKLSSFEKVKGSDKLHIGQFDIGWKKVQIIFGSVYKIETGEILPIALPGAKLPGGEIRISEFQGNRSEGMVCGDDEIGIQNSTEGITRFPTDTLLGKPVAEILGLQGISLDIDNKSLTHRPDLWSHYGFSRELAVILKKKLKDYEALTKYKKDKPNEKLTIKIHNKEISPQFSGCIMTGIKIEESPQWMKSKLQEVGIRPISNVVDVTNYVMVELGQPMHAYDRQIVGTDTLEVRYAKKGEELETIDHKKRKLNSTDPIVTNGKKGMGLAGIMGGAGSEIHDDTTEIILEAANWNPIITRKSSTDHGLRSEASQRFEKGLDPSLTELAVKRAIALLKEMCHNAKMVTPVTTVGNWKPKTIKITVNPESVCSKIGAEIATNEMVQILEALEFKVTQKGKTLEVSVPTHRATGDVEIEEDIVEEIARIYGYDQIDPVLPQLPINLPLENKERFHKHDARSIMAHQLGFSETVNYSFYSKDEFEGCGLEEMRHLKVLNALSSEQTHMRTSLIPGMLKSLYKNSHERDRVKLFEIGRTYIETGEYMPLEEKWISAAVATQSNDEVFYEIKGALEGFLTKFRSPNPIFRECTTPPTYAHPKKCIEILIKGDVIGYAFTLHPGVAKTFNLEHNIGIFELNFTKLVAAGRKKIAFEELPKFPNMPFDVSLLIDRKKPVGDVAKAIRQSDKQGIVRNVKLFDVYQGKGIPENKKSLAFNIELRHDGHTLSDQEFKTAQEAVFKGIEKIGGEVRGG